MDRGAWRATVHQAPLCILFSRGSSWPRDQTQVSCVAGRFSTIWVTREACFLKKHIFKSSQPKSQGLFSWNMTSGPLIMPRRQRAVGTHVFYGFCLCVFLQGILPPQGWCVCCLVICMQHPSQCWWQWADIFVFWPLCLNLYPFQIWKRDMELLYMTYLNPNTFY